MDYSKTISKINECGFYYFTSKNIFGRKFIHREYTISKLEKYWEDAKLKNSLWARDFLSSKDMNTPNKYKPIKLRIPNEEYDFLNENENRFLSLFDQFLCEKVFIKYHRDSLLKKITRF